MMERREGPLDLPPDAAQAFQWHALAVQVGCERRVYNDITDRLAPTRGYLAYLPFFEDTVKHARRVRTVQRPLLAGYLFVANPQAETLGPIRTAPKAIAFLQGARGPSVIPARVMAELIARGDAKGKIMLTDQQIVRAKFLNGQRVRINAGPFTGFGAKISLDDGNFVYCLAQIFGRETRLQLRPEDVQAA